MDIARALLDGAIEGPAVRTLLDLLAVIDELFVEADLLETLYGGPSQSPAAKLNLSASACGCSTTGSNEVHETFNTARLPPGKPSEHTGWTPSVYVHWHAGPRPCAISIVNVSYITCLLFSLLL